MFRHLAGACCFIILHFTHLFIYLMLGNTNSKVITSFSLVARGVEDDNFSELGPI